MIHMKSFSEPERKVGEDPKKVLDSLGLERFCCRALFMGHFDLIDIAGEFKRG